LDLAVGPGRNRTAATRRQRYAPADSAAGLSLRDAELLPDHLLRVDLIEARIEDAELVTEGNNWATQAISL
jgi:hypothetical protein